MSTLLLKFFYPELPQISDELNRKIIATEADSNSAVSCLEEADSHQCVGIPSIHSPGQSCLPPVSSPIERKVSVESPGEIDSFLRLIHNGGLLGYDNSIKYMNCLQFFIFKL